MYHDGDEDVDDAEMNIIFCVRQKNVFGGKELKIRKINLTATVYLNEVTKKTKRSAATENERKLTGSKKER